MTNLTAAQFEWDLSPPLSTRLTRSARSSWKAIRRDKVLAVVTLILLTGLFLALFSTLLARTRYDRVDPANRLQSPSGEHWFGTDTWGRDVFDRTIVGTRMSFLVGQKSPQERASGQQLLLL